MPVALTDRRMAGLLLLAIALVYSGSLRAPFVFDDFGNIRDNPALRCAWPPWRALDPPPADPSFYTRPLINAWAGIDQALWGLKPLGYRLTSLLWHAAAALALWRLLRRVFTRCDIPHAGAAAGAASLIWAVHPLNTSAVSYLSQRGELGVGLFLFLMLLALDRAAASVQALRWLALAFTACLLGMGCKESMAAAPALALLYDRGFLSASWREVFRRRGLFYMALAATVVWPLSRQWLFSPHLNAGLPTSASLRAYWLTQAWGLARMLRLSFWPAPLIFDYGTTLVSTLAEVWLQAAVVTALLLLTLWAAVRRPRAGFAGLCFFGLLTPSLVIPITGQPVAEHRMYVPMAVLTALVVAGGARLAARFPQWQRAAVAVVLLIVLALGSTAVRRNLQYRSEKALLTDTLRKRPGNARAWYNLGVVRQEAGEPGPALDAYSRALALAPDDRKALSNRALIRFQQGDHRPALDDLNRWLVLDPSSADALVRRAAVWQSLGEAVRARQDYDRVIELGDAGVTNLNNLAWLLATAEPVRDPPRAVELAEQAVRISGRNYKVLDTLAVAYGAAGRYSEAAVVSQEAIEAAHRAGDGAFVERQKERWADYARRLAPAPSASKGSLP